MDEEQQNGPSLNLLRKRPYSHISQDLHYTKEEGVTSTVVEVKGQEKRMLKDGRCVEGYVTPTQKPTLAQDSVGSIGLSKLYVTTPEAPQPFFDPSGS